MTDMDHPQEPAAWRAAIEDGMGLTWPEGRDAWQSGAFPYEQFTRWIRETFSDGYSPQFVPALVRNVRGLAAWVYGEGDEPYWPGSDGKDPVKRPSR